MTVRRTLIPILMTLALLMPALAVGARLLPADSPLRVGALTQVLFLVAGPVLGVLAGVNMFTVRQTWRDASR
jgi:hypothetical protein